MLFNSLQFCVFLLVVTTLYYVLPWNWRWKMLLAASCFFYMAFIPVYVLILITTIVIDYWMGLKIAGAEGRRRKVYLVVSIVSTCLVLAVFKYYNFLAVSAQQVAQLFSHSAVVPVASIILPIGLSFHTFQSLSYVIEVYRGKQEPERNFGIYALYVMFYPQLVAGPIERPQNLLHQFYERHRFEVDNILEALALIAWGFFKKMVVADRAAMYANNVYWHWQEQSGLALLLATVMFAVQIYADFSGYSAIAVGCARLMGFRLMRNFNHPYFSCSISEFWKRWHISLSTWFKDYVYIPLGGSRVRLGRHYLNLLITFAVSGLWHGANWVFVVWGVYNGVLLVLESMADRWLRTGPVWNIVRRAVTLALIVIGWIFFRAPNMTAAAGIIGRVFTQTSLSVSSLQNAILQTTLDNTALAVMCTTLLFIAIMFTVEVLTETGLRDLPVRFFSSLRYQAIATVAMVEVILLFGIMQPSAFIYFQF